MHYIRILLLFLCCSFASISYGQLANFNLNVVASDEICNNNGMLEMSVTGATAGAEIIYRLYLAPDFENSIADTSEDAFTSLASGEYLVVATQTLNGVSNTASADVVINNLVELLDFEMTDSGGGDCSTTATIVVNVLSGNPVSYEIISGPVTAPLQSSNEFSDLPSGTYLIRVFDDCNDAISKAYTLVLGGNDITINAPVLPDIYSSCTSVDIQNQLTVNAGSISYPLTVNYTVFAPNGEVDQTYSQNLASGGATTVGLLQGVNVFGNQLFYVKIEVIDNCNNVVTETFPINPNPKLSFTKFQDECGEPYFKIFVKNYLPPFSLNFTAPSNFDPTLFNDVYPEPFDSSPVSFGSEDNTVPFGDYKVSVLDECNRTANLNFSLQKLPIEPVITVANNGCDSQFGNINIRIPQNRSIISIILTEAPLAYAGNLPQDVFQFVDADGVFTATDLPLGQYEFTIIDNCQNEYVVIVEVPAFVFGELVAEVRPTCSPIYGSLKLSTANGALVSVTIIGAPSTYIELLPNDVSYNINADGSFYMTDLPAGTYIFKAVDFCGYTQELSVEIVGYNSSSSGFTLTRKCGAFDITMDDTDESITGKTFWLQKFFPGTNTWGHPTTGVAFTEGTIPTSATGTQLLNPGTLLNIFLTGDFRIIKVFETFNNGGPGGKCADIYTEFIVSAELLISGVYNLNCIGGSGYNDIVIDVIGVEPLNFQITAPYFLDNGPSQVFNDLAPGIYNILATDACGNIKNIALEVSTLLPLARAIKPDDFFECRDDGVQFATFSLSDQTPHVLGSQLPALYEVSYYLSQQDADAGVNPLPDGYTNVSNPQTIYIRVEHKSLKLCYATTSFQIVVGAQPVLSPGTSAFLCDGFSTKLTADVGFESYEWSTGETTQSIYVSEEGTYTITVKNTYGLFSCEATKEFVVTTSGLATIQNIETTDWSSTNNQAVITVTGPGNYVYSLDNVNFQTSSTFNNLLPGFYTVYVKDSNGCGTVNADFVLLNYPKYFTPNGDGYNDTWQIQFSPYEPNLNVDIFDRFGRFIIRLKGGEVGWDGTYNGQELFSTDYWFVVTREDGKVYRGHFSLKR